MKTILLKLKTLTLLLLISKVSMAQCTINSSGCGGYTVDVSITPTTIVPSSMTCPFGFNYNVTFNYSITVSGSNTCYNGNIGIQPQISCNGQNNGYYTINVPAPIVGVPSTVNYTGTLTTTTNPYSNGTNCATATPASENCSSIDISIFGPGISTTTVNCSVVANSITTSAISGSPFCENESLSIPYTVAGTFNPGNTFTAQLSDATGSFASPVSIGTLSATTAGTINATLPNGTPAGNAYRVRVVSDSPATTGSDNGSDLTVNATVIPTITISETQFNLCSGGVDFAAAVTNEGPTPLFQWQVNGVDVPLEENQTFSATGLTNGDLITCELFSSEACPSSSPVLSNTITVTLVGGSTTWLGLSSTWNSPTNWSSGVPNSSVSVIIPPGTPFHPLALAPGSCFNMTVQPGATLEISGSSTLAVYGNFINDGTFIPNTGTLQLLTCAGVGANPHYIGTNNATPITFRNLTLNDASGCILDMPITLTGVLTVTNGNFNCNGNLVTLVSNASGTGRIAALTTGTFSGNIVQQRYIPGPTTGWTLMGTSINGATIADWIGDFPTSGFPGSTGYVGGFISIYGYNETAPGMFDDVASYIPVTATSNSIVNGKGYWVFLGTALTTTSDITTSITGTPRMGTVNFGISYTNSGNPTEDGWNLVANPYPSAIDWDNVNWTKTNMDDAVYIYNADNQQYASYAAGVGTNGGSRFIANSQGFFVKANGAAPSLIAQETVKTNQASTYIRTTDPLNVLRLNLSGNQLNDEAVIRFTADATTGYDKQYEACKKRSQMPNYPSLSVVQNNTDLSICALPKGQSNLAIPLKTNAGTDGQFTLSWSVNNRMEEEYCMMLEDKKTGAFIDMKTFPSYAFEMLNHDDADRFVIHSSHALPTEVSHPSCSSNQMGIITIQNPSMKNVQATLLNKQNEKLGQANFSTSSYAFGDLKPGTYTISFATNGPCQSIEQSFEIKGDEMVSANFSLNKETVEMNLSETIEVSPDYPSANITVDFGDGTIINPAQGENIAQHRYAKEGAYTITVSSRNGECSDTKTIEVLVFNKEQFAASQLGNNLQMDFNFEEGTDVLVNITGTSGQNILSKNYRGLTTGRQNLNLGNMESGIYYVSFSYGDKNVVKKIVK